MLSGIIPISSDSNHYSPHRDATQAWQCHVCFLITISLCTKLYFSIFNTNRVCVSAWDRTHNNSRNRKRQRQNGLLCRPGDSLTSSVTRFLPWIGFLNICIDFTEVNIRWHTISRLDRFGIDCCRIWSIFIRHTIRVPIS